MANVKGIVVVEAIVDINGKVKSARVLESVHPLVNRAAIDSCLGSEFRPALDDCRPVEGTVGVFYEF